MIRFAFWFSVLFIVYTYILYPAIIYMAGRLKGRRPARHGGAEELPSITMIIIAHNEERIIREKIDNCRKLDYPAGLFSVRIVSDGSTDGTTAILEEYDDITLIRDDVNRGKPHQINVAVKGCESGLVVFSDTRQMYEPDALRKLARNFDDPEIGAVSGELVFMSPTDITEKSVGIYWHYEKILRRSESDVDSTLGVTGAIYAIRRELIEEIPDDTILDDIEIPLRAFRKGYRVTFDSDAVAYDTASLEIGLEFRRKVRTLAGNFQLFERNHWLFDPHRNRIFFQTVSHKLFRLLVPYCMILALVSSAMIESAPYRMLFILQAALYAIGTAALKSARLKSNRVVNFISVFISMNAAAVAALYTHMTGGADARWKK